LRAISRYIALLAEGIIVVSDSLGNLLPKSCKFHVIPDGIDLDLFTSQSKKAARSKLGLPSDKKLILFAGNPDMPEKRFELAQKAVHVLKKKLADIELITVKKLPHRAIPLYLNACDVLLLTSWHEGSPNIIKEALACNLPVVSVDVGDISRYIGKIKGCVLCRDNQPETISKALERILCEDIPIRGRDSIVDLDIHITIQKIIAIYESVLTKY
ncbi:unnamed protein product, partial [marine sediment metagenome]